MMMCMDEYDEAVKRLIQLGEETSCGGLFARVSWEDWEEIKRMPTKELKHKLKEMEAYLKHTVSIIDLQYRDLLALELEKRESRRKAKP
jgi:hypothetical protein